jgi:hypothetical protein
MAIVGAGLGGVPGGGPDLGGANSGGSEKSDGFENPGESEYTGVPDGSAKSDEPAGAEKPPE